MQTQFRKVTWGLCSWGGGRIAFRDRRIAVRQTCGLSQESHWPGLSPCLPHSAVSVSLLSPAH